MLTGFETVADLAVWLSRNCECSLLPPDPKTRCLGVTRGSVLGPLLFLIFTYDLHNCLSSKCILCADSANLPIYNTKLSSLYRDSNKDLLKVKYVFYQ